MWWTWGPNSQDSSKVPCKAPRLGPGAYPRRAGLFGLVFSIPRPCFMLGWLHSRTDGPWVGPLGAPGLCLPYRPAKEQKVSSPIRCPPKSHWADPEWADLCYTPILRPMTSLASLKECMCHLARLSPVTTLYSGAQVFTGSFLWSG